MILGWSGRSTPIDNRREPVVIRRDHPTRDAQLDERAPSGDTGGEAERLLAPAVHAASLKGGDWLAVGQDPHAAPRRAPEAHDSAGGHTGREVGNEALPAPTGSAAVDH